MRGRISEVTSLIAACEIEVRRVLFDIMTGLERLVQIYTGSNQALRRYLTLFYGITLGLALILAILAISSAVKWRLPDDCYDHPGGVTTKTASPTRKAHRSAQHHQAHLTTCHPTDTE